MFVAEKQERWSGHYPTFRVFDTVDENKDLGLYTRTDSSTVLIAKSHLVGEPTDRPYQIRTDHGNVHFLDVGKRFLTS